MGNIPEGVSLSNKFPGKFLGIIVSEVQNATACSMTFSSSRMFPGQLYDNKKLSVSWDMELTLTR